MIMLVGRHAGQGGALRIGDRGEHVGGRLHPHQIVLDVHGQVVKSHPGQKATGLDASERQQGADDGFAFPQQFFRGIDAHDSLRFKGTERLVATDPDEPRPRRRAEYEPTNSVTPVELRIRRGNAGPTAKTGRHAALPVLAGHDRTHGQGSRRASNNKTTQHELARTEPLPPDSF